jgi:hypothetical protein
MDVKRSFSDTIVSLCIEVTRGSHPALAPIVRAPEQTLNKLTVNLTIHHTVVIYLEQINQKIQGNLECVCVVCIIGLRKGKFITVL